MGFTRGLKNHNPDFNKGFVTPTNQVTPDEIDTTKSYSVIFPAISATWLAAVATGTVSQARAMTMAATTCDYPRSVASFWTGSASNSGTMVVTGKNQFGGTQTESLALAQGTQWSGTANGTKVFAQVSAATCSFGTGVTGTGTVSLGFSDEAGSAVFGIPDRIAGTADVLGIQWADETGLSVALNGGTIGAYVDATNHSFRGTEALAGTMVFTCLYKPSYAPVSSGTLANLTQI